MDRASIIRLESVDSTQKWARRHLNSLENPSCIVADRQTSGHGQYGRSWRSPEGGLYMTLYFTLAPDTPRLEQLAQKMALIVARILEQRGYRIEVKWPNDLLIEDKKVGGLLCEVISGRDAIEVLAGIGINIEMRREELEAIDQPATALEHCKGTLPSRDELLGEILNAITT